MKSMTIKPKTPGRIVFSETNGKLIISISHRKNKWLLAFTIYWLLIWVVFGGVAGGLFSWLVFSTPVNMHDVTELNALGLFLAGFIIFFCFWAIGSTFGIYAFLWELAGSEIIEVTDAYIKTRREVVGLGRSKVYFSQFIKELKVFWEYVPRTYSQYLGIRRFKSLFVGGSIVFQYGANQHRFGIELSEPEAKQIVEAIQKQFLKN